MFAEPNKAARGKHLGLLFASLLSALLFSGLLAAQVSVDPAADIDTSVQPDSASISANASAGTAAATPLSNQVEDLKQAVLDLNRDLLILEEELLFPANTQVAVFLSMDVGEFFQLDSVSLEIDNKVVASHLYTPQQADALFRGGVQRLYMGNLRAGLHTVTAFFTGLGPNGREYKRGATVTVEKALEPKMLELRLIDSTQKLQPVFEIKEWQL